MIYDTYSKSKHSFMCINRAGFVCNVLYSLILCLMHRSGSLNTRSGSTCWLSARAALSAHSRWEPDRGQSSRGKLKQLSWLLLQGQQQLQKHIFQRWTLFALSQNRAWNIIWRLKHNMTFGHIMFQALFCEKFKQCSSLKYACFWSLENKIKHIFIYIINLISNNLTCKCGIHTFLPLK